MDDDDALRTELRRLLETEGYGVVEASSEREDIYQYCNEPTDMIIIGLSRSEQEGSETLQILRHDVPNVKIIAMLDGMWNVESEFSSTVRRQG